MTEDKDINEINESEMAEVAPENDIKSLLDQIQTGTEKVEELEQKIKALTDEKEKYREYIIDKNNQVDRIQKDQERLILAAKMKTLKDMTSFFSVLYSASSTIKDDTTRKGMEMIVQSVLSSFEKNSVIAIIPKVGDELDTEVHEIVSTTKAPSPDKVNTIAQLISPGFIYQPAKNVISFAQVIVFN